MSSLCAENIHSRYLICIQLEHLLFPSLYTPFLIPMLALQYNFEKKLSIEGLFHIYIVFFIVYFEAAPSLK